MGALLLPLTLLAPPQATPIRLAPVTFLATSVAAPSHSVLPWVKVLSVLWLMGSSVLLLRLAVGYLRVALVLRSAIPSDGFSISDVSVPMVVGLFHPAILMPVAAESWPLSQRAAALRHERAHIERKDLWTNLIAHLACAVYWFHPLAWVLARRLRSEQEAACDDAVLCSGFEPTSYAEALIATARQIPSTNLIGCHMTQETLKSRIARLLENGLPRMSSPSNLRRTAIGVLAIAVVIALLNGDPRARAANQQPPAPQPASQPAPEPVAQTAAQTTPQADSPKVARDAQPPAGDGEEAGTAGHVYASTDAGVTGPALIEKSDPVYTEEAKAAKISGTVALSFIVGTDGLAHDIAIVSGIDPGLDQNAIDAIQRWRFQPATKDGEPVLMRAKAEVKFKLL